MSEKTNLEVRLLKANNMQRRRFEKLADDAIWRAKAVQSTNNAHKKDVIYNQTVEKTMGADLQKLLELRAEIQQAKLALEELTRKAEPIRVRLNKRGIDTSSSYGNIQRFDFYLNPPAVDYKSTDVCEKVVGNPMVQLRLMDCPNNKPYAEYQKNISSLIDEEEEFAAACEELRANIWSVVSTEDILGVLAEFKKVWC